MTYSLTTGISYFEHLQTINTIERSGRRVETAIHSGLMSLATAQVDAMQKLGTKIDDRLVGIDEALNGRFDEIKFCLDGISEQLGRGFTALNGRLADIESTLARINHGIDNREETLARERFRRAIELYKAGNFAPALENIDHAITNGDGPSFSHISEFQVLKGTIHMGSPENLDPSVIDPRKAHEAFLSAAKFYAVKNVKGRLERADLYYQAGLAAYAAGNPMAAIEVCRLALKDYDAASDDYYGKNSCFAHFQIARAGLVISDVPLVRKHLVRAIDMNWKLLAAVAADPDCIAHHSIVEPIVSDYVKRTLPEARRELEALNFILVGGAARNVSKMHQKLHKATLPEDVEGNTRHFRLESFEEETRSWRDPDDERRYWRSFDFYSPYPAGLSETQARAIGRLLRNDVGLLDIAVAMERLDAEGVTTEALRRTGRYWEAVGGLLASGMEELKQGRLPRAILPSSWLKDVPCKPKLETGGGFIARKRARKQFEVAVAERERALTAAEAVIERDRKKVVALASKKLPGVLAKCMGMIVRSEANQKKAERAIKTLHPERRWKVIGMV